MSSTHHLRHSIQEWLDNINERTPDPIPVPRALTPDSVQYLRDPHPHHGNGVGTRVGLTHRKSDALRTTARKLPSWKVLQEPDRLGVQTIFHTLDDGKKKYSCFPQPDTGRKRARARGSSDSSFLEIGLGNNGLPTHGTKKARFSPSGKPKRCAESGELNCLGQDMGQSREPQRAFERRPRHRTRKSLYDSKSPRRKRKTALGGRTKQTSTRRIREKPGDALHQSFASETISKGRLTLKPSSRVGLFKRGRASSPVRKRGLPDLAFSEMQFLHDQRKSANGRLQERQGKKKQCGKDRDNKLHEKISSYFATTQRSLEEEGVSCGFPSSPDVRKRTLTIENRGDRESYLTPSEVSPTHLSSGRSPRPPLASGPECASASHSQHLEPTVGPGRDMASEMTDRFTWSVSVRSVARLDASTNENGPRTTGSLCLPYPKAAIDIDQANHGDPPGSAADPPGSAADPPGSAADPHGRNHERRNQDNGLAPQRRKQSTCVEQQNRSDCRGTSLDIENALDRSEQPIPNVEGQLELRIPAWLEFRRDRGASNGQHPLDPDRHNITRKSEDQSSPSSAVTLRDYEIVPRILSRRNSAEASPIASASCGVRLGRTAGPRAELVVFASAPIGADSEIQRAGLVTRPEYGSSVAALNETLSLDPPSTWVSGHQRDERDYYSLSGVIGLHRGKEKVIKRPRPPSPCVPHTDVTACALPFNDCESQKEGNSNAFYICSTKQDGRQTRLRADRNLSQTDTQGGSVLTTRCEDLKEMLRPQSCVALGPADVDIAEFSHYQQCRYKDTALGDLWIRSPSRIPGNIISISSEKESPEDRRLDSDPLEACGSIHGISDSLPSGYPNIEGPFAENSFHGIYGSQGQNFRKERDTRREDELRTRPENVNGLSIANFWRPHRLY